VAYRADIEIGVKGTERLRDLRNTIDDLSKRINKLDELANVFNAPIQSIRNYTQSLNTAASALQKVELGTTEETRAVKQYVQALGEANTARARQNNLIDAEIKRRQENARVQKLTAQGIFETTRFPEPIGPAEASQVTLKSEIRGRVNQILQLEKASVNASNAAFDAAVKHEQTLKALELKNDDDIFKAKLRQLDALAAQELKQIKQTDAAALADFDRRLENRVAKRQRTREATSNAIIGGAFPLLFGQGLGASIGGGIGGFAGGLAGGQMGFGLSLVGTAVGASLDQTIQSAKDFAKSIRQGGDAAAYLEQRLGYLNPTIKTQLQNLQASGQTAKAAELAFSELAKTMGTEGASAFLEIGKQSEQASRSLNLLIDRFVGAGYAANKFFQEAKFGKGGSITDLLPQQFRPTPITETPAETAAATQRTAELTKSNDLLRLQVQLTAVSAKGDLDRYITLQKQTAQKEYENELTKLSIQLKTGEIDLAQKEQLIRGANLKLSIQLGEIERTRVQELARRQEEAAQAAQQQLQARAALTKSIFDEQLKLVDINIRQQEFAGGAEAAARQSLRLSATRARLTEESLSAERDQALEEAKKNGTVEQTLRLYDLKLKSAQRELDLLDATNERIIDRNNLEKELSAIQRQRDTTRAVTPLLQQQERTRLDIAGFTQPADLIERERLLLDQRIRTAETILPIEEKIADLNAEILSGTLDTNALAAKQADLAAQQQKLGLLNQELQVLNQLEVKQLQIQQFTAKYGQLIQSISGEMANVVTNGLSELVRGTKTAEQVFADFLQSVGAALIQAAQQMIAQYIAIGIARIFAGLGGGLGGGGNAGTAAGGLPGSSLQGGFANPLVGQYSAPLMFANGGAVSAGSPYVVGEHGPELFVPGRNGSVVSNDNLRSAMGAAPGSGSPVLSMSFQTTSIGGVEYVSRDQLEAAMAETRRQATRDGASRGMSMTLDRIKQSPQTRSRIGIR
jgi:phage-related minor tail protein